MILGDNSLWGTFEVTAYLMGFFIATLTVFDRIYGGREYLHMFAIKNEYLKTQNYFGTAYRFGLAMPDLIYGRNIISVRSVLASASISIVWFFLLLFVSLVRDGGQHWLFNPAFKMIFIKILPVYMGLGLLADYISMSLTRVILTWAAARKVATQLTVMVFDLVASALIFYWVFVGGKLLLLGSGGALIDSIASWIKNPLNLHMISVLVNDAKIHSDNMGGYILEDFNAEILYAFPEGVFFISGLFTSFWFWWVVMAKLLEEFAAKYDFLKTFAIKTADIYKNPLCTLFVAYFIPVFFVTWLFVWLLNTLYKSI